ncbi:MAG: DNA-processing protein DprA, partial [Solirubrobacteraceae bacterium]
CAQCERRAWLLEKLGMRLDFSARELTRLWSLLELSDSHLIDAVGGRRREELHETHRAWVRGEERAEPDVERICRHHASYPACLRGDALAPTTLGVRGGLDRLHDVLARKVVAVVGTRRATDYGMQLARELARGLASCGLTVASGMGEGIAGSVQAGVLEAGAMPLAVMTGSLDRCSPVCCEPVYRRVVKAGCAISEQALSGQPRERSWWRPAADRTLALLGELTIVVEAGEHPREMASARVAWTRGAHVAAVPGRVTSPASKGANELLMNGARLVRNAQDALDALYGVDGMRVGDEPSEQASAPTALEPRLARVLADVGRGKDTVARLTEGPAEPGELALALAELELKGLLVRGDAGRYVACGP